MTFEIYRLAALASALGLLFPVKIYAAPFEVADNFEFSPSPKTLVAQSVSSIDVESFDQCFWSFAQNCRRGFYLFLGYSSSPISGDNSSFSYSQESTLDVTGGGSDNGPDFYDLEQKLSAQLKPDSKSLNALNGGFGYDFGGLRTELSYSTFSSNLKLKSSGIRLVDTYTDKSGDFSTVIFDTDSPDDFRSFVPDSTSGIWPSGGSVKINGSRVVGRVALDFPTGTPIIPYVGAGGGVLIVSSSTLNVKATDTISQALNRSCVVGRCNASTFPETIRVRIKGGSAVVPVAQLFAGLNLALTEKLFIFSEIGLQLTSSYELGDLKFSPSSGLTAATGVRFKL